MLDLYHWEPNGACGRVMFTLKEKSLDFKSHYVDILAFEQHKADFLRLNESGEVPVLVDDGEAMNESSYICEYLEEAYPQTPLMPKAPLERWAVRVWQKYVDDYAAAAVSDIAWTTLERSAFLNRDRATIDKAVERIPLKERRDAWKAAVDGYPEDQLARSRERIEEMVNKMEQDLGAAEWLAGSTYSIADISIFAYANYLPGVMPDVISKAKTPKTMAWLSRMKERPAIKATMAMAKRPEPFATAAPGPEHVRWG